jgi:ABC-2 type transport system permease protein
VSVRRAAALVARREIAERLRQRSFLVSTGVTLIILAAVILLPSILGFGDRELTVRVAGPEAERIAREAARGAPALDLELRVEPAPSAQAARAAVREGSADIALAGTPPRIVVEDELDDDVGALIQQAAARQRAAAALAARGLDARERRAVLEPDPLPVDALAPDDGDGDEAVGLAAVAVILLYGQLLMYGTWIASGVVEEKASRIVEVLLATIPSRALLAGKLLGLGALGLGQLVVIGGLGAALTVATGVLDVPAGAWRTLATVVAFFVLGYALYASLYAVAGAIVQRQEDLQSSTMPLAVIVLAGFFVGIQALQEPDGGLAQAASFVPPTMPMVMPVRIITGEAAAWEVAVAVLILLATAAALVAAASRIYANAILRTGGRIRLREAWQAQ